MRFIFKFPDIGEGIHEGKILKWYVEKGQAIQAGDPVVQMETDKVVADIPSPRTGTIAARYGKVGEVIHVDDPLVEIVIPGVEGEEARAIAQEKPSVKGVEEKGFGVVGTLEVAGDAAYLPAGDEGVFTRPPQEEEPVRPERRVPATPVARAMAKDLGLDILAVTGSGPGGRITKEDVLRHDQQRREGKARRRPVVEAPPDAPRVEVVELSQIRKAIARNMTVSKHTAAHMTLIEEVEISELVRLREAHKGKYEARGTKLTYLPFILKAVVEGLKRHRSLNAEMDLDGGKMIFKRYYNIGIAVDAEDGLVVPVVRDVDKLSVFELSKKLQELAEKARTRKLTLEDFRDGTFTVTNYGAIGGLFGVPVINYPQAAILGIGRIHQKPVVKDGQLAPGTVLPLSLSVDHRIVDGGDATRFVNGVMEFLRDPYNLLLA